MSLIADGDLQNHITIGSLTVRFFMKPFTRMFISVLIFITILFGGGSLLFMGLFLFFGPFHLIVLKMDTAAVLGLDMLLCLAFFFQHSIMIRKSFRHRLERLIPLHYHGIFYTLVSSSTLMLMLIFWQDSGIVLFRFGGGFHWVLMFVFFSGVVVFILGVRALKTFDAFGIRSILNRFEKQKRQRMPLSIRGPYRWVRHPLYFCTIILVWSCPVITADRLLFNVLCTTWIVIGTRLEELDLVSEYGPAYQAYQHEVPMLVPWKPRLWFGTADK